MENFRLAWATYRKEFEAKLEYRENVMKKRKKKSEKKGKRRMKDQGREEGGRKEINNF